MPLPSSSNDYFRNATSSLETPKYSRPKSEMTDFQQKDPEIFCNQYASEAGSEFDEKASPIQSYCSNFKSGGYMPVNPEYIEKLQFTGRKTFAFWTLVAILIILAIGNLCLTFIILSVLRMGGNMESIEFVHKQDAIKFFGETDLGHLYKRNGKLEGFQDVPIEIASQDSSIIFNLSSKFGRVSNKFKMNKTATTFDSVNKFVVKDENDKLIYSSVDPSFNSIKSANNLKSKLTLTNRISSPVKEDLNIRGKTVNFKGAEGTNINGKLVFWSADQDLHFKTVNGSIILTSKKDIFINMKNMPTGSFKPSARTHSQYKICVCMPQGKLFRIPVSGLNSVVSCNHVDMSSPHNPCY